MFSSNVTLLIDINKIILKGYIWGMEGLYIIIAFNLINIILALIFHDYCKKNKVKHICLDNPIFIFACFLGFVGTAIILLVMYIEIFSKKLYD